MRPFKAAFLIALLFLGAWLRFHALARDMRFHPDEALFTTFARAAAINGNWMLPGALDKPPLAIYANALSMVFVGESEFAARLPGTLASVLLSAVVYALARYLFKNDTLSLTAAVLVALSPYAIAFSATALTDGLMLLFMALALWMAISGRWAWSGLWLGLGFASKQQALFYLPLLLLLAWSLNRLSRRGLARFALAFTLVCAALVLWDAARGGTSLFALAAYNNDPARLIRTGEILPRLAAWLEHGQFLFGSRWTTAGLTAVALVTLAARVIRQPRRRAVVIDLMLFTWLIAYFWLHWLVAFNTYDRYLLPALLVIILLVARGLHPVFRRYAAFALPISLCALLLGTAIDAGEGRIPINDEGAQYAGIDALADYLNAKPVATVIYDRWLGWELGYYMGQWTDKRRVYYPTPNLLARGALSLCETGTRYFPAPAAQPLGHWLAALREAGFGVERAYDTPEFVVYALTPPGADASSAEASCPGRWAQCAGEPPSRRRAGSP